MFLGFKSTHINDNIVSGKLPRIEVQPIVRNLDLISVDNLLLEDTISISKSIAPSRVVERGERVEETSSQSA